MAVIEIGGILAKRCKGCEVTKEMGRFHSDTSSKDGRSSYCADCRNARQRARRAHRNRKKSDPQCVLALALRLIKVRGPSALSLGICANVGTAMSAMAGVDRCMATDAELVMRDLMVKWPGGTGSRAFPVPHPSTPHGWVRGEQARAGQAYSEHSLGGLSMWDRETGYGASRWALLEWMTEQLPEVA